MKFGIQVSFDHLQPYRQEREERSKEERQNEQDIYSDINAKIQQSQSILFIEYKILKMVNLNSKLKKNDCSAVDQAFKKCLSENNHDFNQCLSFYEEYQKCLYPKE